MMIHRECACCGEVLEEECFEGDAQICSYCIRDAARWQMFIEGVENGVATGVATGMGFALYVHYLELGG